MSALKTPTGIAFFDARRGGVYAGRCWLLSGPSGTGKSAVGLQFLGQGIRQGEHGLLLSIQRAVDTVLWASSHGPQMEQAIENGGVAVLEYGDVVPGRDKTPNPNLPPEGFLDLQRIVIANAVKRVVLDTVLPWAMPQHPDTMNERVFSLVHALERLGCTTLLTLPRPVSPMAARLKEALERLVPVAVDLALSLDNGQRTWLTTKYLGDTNRPAPIAYALVPGVGAQADGDAPPKAAAAAVPPPARVRFAQAVLGAESHAVRAPDRTARFGMTITR